MKQEIKNKTKYKFPHGFLWGAATSAHQVEGGNVNSDWWAWENSLARENELRSQGKEPEDYKSGIACDSYNRYDEDFELAQHLHHNATRLSIEWARIEPKEGEYNEAELDHYEKVLQSAKAHGLTTFVTLHHYTNPKWFISKGGFTKSANVHHFTEYAKVAVKRLSEYADFWITFNEPEIYASHSYLLGKYPPRKRSLWLCWKTIRNLIKAHNLTSGYIRHHIKKPVSMAYHLSDLQPSGILGRSITSLVHYLANEYMLSKTIQQCDFIGVNYYFHHHISLFGHRKRSLSNHDETDMGWGIHPDGLERVLLNLKKHNKPIYITENGLADAKDKKREKFIKDHLFYIHKAMDKGVDVRGYLYWSLLDNFEWTEGFSPRFGLVEVDRDDLLRRKVRYSAVRYAEVCQNNYLEY